jgi:hypothetical protein
VSCCCLWRLWCWRRAGGRCLLLLLLLHGRWRHRQPRA